MKGGYHLTEIPKGEYGDFSKIKEEFLELQDAHEQGSRIMEGLELADLLGAIEAYAFKHLDLHITDIIKMKDITERAFKLGER